MDCLTGFWQHPVTLSYFVSSHHQIYGMSPTLWLTSFRDQPLKDRVELAKPIVILSISGGAEEHKKWSSR